MISNRTTPTVGVLVVAAMMLLPSGGAAIVFPSGSAPAISLVPVRELHPPVAALTNATLNVQAYVAKNRPDGGPLGQLLRNATVMDPRTAAAIIKKFEDRPGLHTRLALLDLLSWQPDDPRVRAVLRTAVGTLVGRDKTDAIYAQLPHLHAGGACQGADWEEEQLALNRLLNGELNELKYKQCDPLEAAIANVFEDQNSISVVSKVFATAPLEAVQKGLDAQRWQTCAPELWDQSYLVAVDAGGNIKEHNCTPPTNPGCMPDRGIVRTLPYDTDKLVPKQPLFERFICDQWGCDVRLLLHIIVDMPSGAVWPDPVYVLEYLDPAQWKNFDWANPDRGKVKIFAQDIPMSPNKKIVVDSNKVFGFKDWGYNPVIAIMLQRVQMGRYLAELACCNP